MATRSRRRSLGIESLETRIVLDGAGWLTWDGSPWQNSFNPFDANGDGSVSAGDAIVIQNAINSMSPGNLAGMVAPPSLQGLVGSEAASAFLDTNGDGALSAVDAISIVNHMNTGRMPSDLFPPEAIQQGMINMGDIGAELPEFGTGGFGSVIGSLDQPGDTDSIQIVASHDRLSITGLNLGDVDVAIQVYNDQLELVADTNTDAFDFPINGNTSAWQDRLDLPVEPGQQYSVVIQSGDQSDTGEYVLDLLNYDFDQWSDADAPQPGSQAAIDPSAGAPDGINTGDLDDTHLTDAGDPTPTFDGGIDDTHLTDAGDPTPTFDGGISDDFGTQGGDPTPTFDGGISDDFGTQGGDPTPTFDGGINDDFGTQGGDPTPSFDGGISDDFGTQFGDTTPSFDGGMTDDFGTQFGDTLPTADRDGAMSVNLGFMGMGSAQGILTETGQTDVFRMNVIPGTTIGIAAFGSLPLDIQVFDGQGQAMATPGTDGFPGTTQIEVGDATTLFISVGGSHSDYLGQYGIDVFQTSSWSWR